MGRTADSAAVSPAWSPREIELLAVTLRLLQEHGYDRLTLDAVAAAARASKATVHRRWPTKAALVLAAFIEGTHQDTVPPDTGALRTDLLQMGDAICKQARRHAGTIRAVLVAASRDPALNRALKLQVLDRHKVLMAGVLRRAVERGEIDNKIINNDLWDVLPGYLFFRSIMPGRPPTRRTVRTLVDDVILPGLFRSVGTG